MDQPYAISPEAIPPHVDPARVVDYDVFKDRRYAEAGSLHDGLFQLAEEIGRGTHERMVIDLRRASERLAAKAKK